MFHIGKGDNVIALPCNYPSVLTIQAIRLKVYVFAVLESDY
jgi:hypothetical protein